MSHTETHEYFGLNCASGGKFYICEDAHTQFIGCCTSDPCGPRNGTCPEGSLRASSFNTDAYEELPTQDCDGPRGTDMWYSCKLNNPSFMGCCAENACANGGCPRNRLVPAKLSENEKNRLEFLAPSNSSSTFSAASSSSSTSSSSPNGSESNDGSSRRGIIAGITTGATVTGLLLLAFLLWRFWWQPLQRKKADKQCYPTKEMAHRPHGPAPSIPAGVPQQSSMSNYELSFAPTPTIEPYYGGVSSRGMYQHQYLPQIPQFERSQPLSEFLNSAICHNRGIVQPYEDAPITPVQEMDGTTTVAQELSTGQEHSISQNQNLNPG
ncbi:hypothetical protein ACKAV7_014662 [Fusarium commune]